LVLHDHFSVDRIQMLRTSADLELEFVIREIIADRLDKLLDECLALFTREIQFALDVIVGFAVKDLEGEIFELPLHRAESEPMSKGGVELHCFAG
ncbi:MAG: hypothetical protein ACK55I_08925, partial [bacterium]